MKRQLGSQRVLCPLESPFRDLGARGKDVGCCCFGGGNTSLSKLLVHLLYARLSARASVDAVGNPYTKPEASVPCYR